MAFRVALMGSFKLHVGGFPICVVLGGLGELGGQVLELGLKRGEFVSFGHGIIFGLRGSGLEGSLDFGDFLLQPL